jgi:secreted protein with Ig-like and vWFA domain
MAPNQNLQNDNKNNVLYDSNQDEGPQFQTLINPKDKSVTVKFVDSPEKAALTDAVNTPPQGGQAQPAANPNLQTPAPVQSQAPGNQTGEFGGEQSNPQVQF